MLVRRRRRRHGRRPYVLSSVERVCQLKKIPSLAAGSRALLHCYYFDWQAQVVLGLSIHSFFYHIHIVIMSNFASLGSMKKKEEDEEKKRNEFYAGGNSQGGMSSNTFIHGFLTLKSLLTLLTNLLINSRWWFRSSNSRS